MNQHLSILNFLTLGIVVGADELVVTSARSRSNFSATASWESRDISELWNTTKIAKFLSGWLPGLHTAAHHMCSILCTLTQSNNTCSHAPVRFCAVQAAALHSSRATQRMIVLYILHI